MGIPSSSRRKPFSRSGAAPSTPTPPRAFTGPSTAPLRLSSHPVARALAQAVGEPITSSSANISGNPAVVSVNQLDEELIASVMGILDEPPVPAGGLPSTLVERMEDGRLRLLRAGAVTSAQIAEAGFEVVEEE